MRDSTRDPNRVDSGRNPGGGTDFRKALAHANVRSVMDRTTPAPLSGGNGNHPASGANYVVRNGDTMTGIAQKLLAARGQEAGPQASLRAALQLARANGISNPDRIRPGQTIDTNLLTQASGNGNGYSNNLSSRSLAAPQQFSHASQALKGLRPVHDRSSAPLNHHPVLEKTLDRAVSLQYFDASQKDAVRDKVMQLARQHQFSPDDLAIVTLIESDGMNPRATNGRCHGVIQFCDGPNRGAATVGFADNPKGILDLSVLDQLDLIPFRGVHKGDDAARGGLCRTIGKRKSLSCSMECKLFQIIHLEGEVCQVRSNHNRPRRGVTTNFNQLLAFRRFEKHQLGTPRRTVSGDFFEAEHPGVKGNGALKVFNPVTGMEEFGDHGLLFFGLPVGRSLWTILQRRERYKAASFK
jgi:LysM repeat protein